MPEGEADLTENLNRGCFFFAFCAQTQPDKPLLVSKKWCPVPRSYGFGRLFRAKKCNGCLSLHCKGGLTREGPWIC